MAVAYLYISKDETRSVDAIRSELMSRATADGESIECWTVERGDNLCRPSKDIDLLFMSVNPGGVLYVNDIISLGGTINDIVAVLVEAAERDVEIRDLEGRYRLPGARQRDTYLATLKFAGELNTRIISSRTRVALGRRRQDGVRLGRPQGSMVKMQVLIDNEESIEKDFAEGTTSSEICRKYGVSPTTFRRYLKKYARPTVKSLEIKYL